MAAEGGGAVTIDEVALRVATALNAAQLPFMLVGGFSSNYHGIPRSTKDADFVVQLSAPLNESFTQILGPDFSAEPQMSFETNTGTQRQEFRVNGTLFKVEIFRLSDDPHDQERFRRRQAVLVKGCPVVFPTAEDVIIWKLRWARAKDRDDIRAVMGVQGNKLDWVYIEAWCDRHGTRKLMEEIRRTVPKV
jgi:predicted nucleotidyltransferase